MVNVILKDVIMDYTIILNLLNVYLNVHNFIIDVFMLDKYLYALKLVLKNFNLKIYQNCMVQNVFMEINVKVYFLENILRE